MPSYPIVVGQDPINENRFQPSLVNAIGFSPIQVPPKRSDPHGLKTIAYLVIAKLDFSKVKGINKMSLGIHPLSGDQKKYTDYLRGILRELKVVKGPIFGIFGSYDEGIYLSSAVIMEMFFEARIVFLPGLSVAGYENLEKIGIEFLLEANKNGPKIVQLKSVATELRSSMDFRVGFFTSGSTGKPKIVLIGNAALIQTVTWYKNIYGLTINSLVVSSLPASYNFTVVAGIFTSILIGNKFSFAKTGEHPLFGINATDFDRVVLLSNPIQLDHLVSIGTPLPPESLVDSGGAPLSASGIKWFRGNMGDLREGYGLTESCSLTHFDSTARPESLGTVGHGLPGVRTEIQLQKSKPIICITSPNLGSYVDPNTGDIKPLAGLFSTGDLGKIDSNGYLTILGRGDDFSVNGHWPKDTMDFIGERLGFSCFLVQHPSPEAVVVKFFSKLSEKIKESLRDDLSQILSLPNRAVKFIGVGSELLYSLKITRKLEKN